MDLKLENVAKVYRRGESKVFALRDVSLDVETGEFLAIQGPSGSGKSTLLHIIGCLDSPTSGKVLLDGDDVSDLTDSERSALRRAKIGFVFQFFYLLPTLDALGNVELPMTIAGVPGKERGRRAAGLLEKVDLTDRAEHRPSELSGGESQRVAIARAMANNPPLLLADEPTGNLDTKSGRKVMELLEDLNREGKTLIVGTHDPKIADFTEKILRIVDGSIEGEANA